MVDRVTAARRSSIEDEVLSLLRAAKPDALSACEMAMVLPWETCDIERVCVLLSGSGKVNHKLVGSKRLYKVLA